MKIHLITIGSEILIGHTVNSNFVYIAQELAKAGFTVNREVCIPDDKRIMHQTFSEELAAADIVITMGGLGPTKDDITRQVAAEILGNDLVEDEAVLNRIQDYLRQRQVKLPADAARTQARVPCGAEVLPNANGTAPGLWCPAGDGKVLVLLPGPPRELKGIFSDQVMPRLQKRWQAQVYRKELSICGIPESQVEAEVEKIADTCQNTVEISYCARPSQVEVRVTGETGQKDDVDAAAKAIREHFGTAVLDEGEEDVVGAIGKLMRQQNRWLAVAESCTGGQLGKRLTDKPGASSFFAGGYVCYRNDWKEKKLGVKSETLEHYGAVSREAAKEMLTGLVSREEDVDCGIVTSGIAGPEGGTPAKPVGLVYIGTAVGDEQKITEHHFPGSRENVRERTTAYALNQLREQLLMIGKTQANLKIHEK
ncbi:MAG: competence/damage-inducible protein A [Verrucomicrobiota bacterium]